MTNTHHVDDLLPEDIHRRANAALIMAVVRGSTGATQIEEVRLPDGSLQKDSTTVERINQGGHRRWQGSCAFRVLNEGNDVVIIAPAAPGRLKSHAA